LIGWVWRWALLWVGIAMLAFGVRHYVAAYHEDRPRPVVATPVAKAVPRPVAEAPSNTLVFRADKRGHVTVQAWVNGAPVELLVDTGASRVALTPEAALAAGISRSELVYSEQTSTAAGLVRAAPVTLREVRLDQLSVYDVPATVIDQLPMSLLGMSFLNRLESYEMRDGQLTITW